MKLCVATLLEFLSLTVQICSAVEKSFVIVDRTKVYLVTAHNSTKFFGEKHNMTESIHFLNAKLYEKAFVAVYGACSDHLVRYIQFRISANFTSIGLITAEALGDKYGVCGVVPASENTFYVTTMFGRITFYDLANSSSLTEIMPRIITYCRFNPLLDDEKRLLYYLEGRCTTNTSTTSELLLIMDIVNNITKNVSLSEPVQKMEIDFTTNETFAISGLSDLMKGKIDSNTMTLETFRKVSVKIKDIALTPSELYFITNDGSIMKMKRSDNDVPEQVFKSITFNSPAGIAYAQYDASGKGSEKGFSSSISLHLAFYVAMILVNLELWKL